MILYRTETEEVVRDIIDFSLKINLFNRDIYNVYCVLTSKSIQERYIQAQKRCKNPIREEFDCINVAETPVIATETPVSVTKTPENGNGNQNVNVNQSTQYGKSNETRFSDDNGEAARREELLRMAEEATRSC